MESPSISPGRSLAASLLGLCQCPVLWQWVYHLLSRTLLGSNSELARHIVDLISTLSSWSVSSLSIWTTVIKSLPRPSLGASASCAQQRNGVALLCHCSSTSCPLLLYGKLLSFFLWPRLEVLYQPLWGLITDRIVLELIFGGINPLSAVFLGIKNCGILKKKTFNFDT